MPVVTTEHIITVHASEEANFSAGTKFLYKILDDISGFGRTHPTLFHKKMTLLQNAVLKAYDVNTSTVDVSVLQEYFKEDGSPISLEDHLLKIDYSKFDGIERLRIFQECHVSTLIIMFDKCKGGRTMNMKSLDRHYPHHWS